MKKKIQIINKLDLIVCKRFPAILNDTSIFIKVKNTLKPFFYIYLAAAYFQSIYCRDFADLIFYDGSFPVIYEIYTELSFIGNSI